MTKLSFQLPTLNKEVSEESKINASYAMLGVVAITAIVSLVFVFQHMLVTPSFGDSTAFVISQTSTDQCTSPSMVISPSDSTTINYLRNNLKYSCSHFTQDAWCCIPPSPHTLA